MKGMFKEKDMKSTEAWKILQRIGGTNCRENMIVEEYCIDDEYTDYINLIRLKVVQEERSEIELCLHFGTGKMLISVYLFHFGEMAYTDIQEHEIEDTIKQIYEQRMKFFEIEDIQSIF